jgi:hypothetical protein
MLLKILRSAARGFDAIFGGTSHHQEQHRRYLRAALLMIDFLVQQRATVLYVQ